MYCNIGQNKEVDMDKEARNTEDWRVISARIGETIQRALQEKKDDGTGIRERNGVFAAGGKQCS